MTVRIEIHDYTEPTCSSLRCQHLTARAEETIAIAAASGINVTAAAFFTTSRFDHLVNYTMSLRDYVAIYGEQVHVVPRDVAEPMSTMPLSQIFRAQGNCVRLRQPTV